MYTPEKRIIRSYEAAPEAIDSSYWKEANHLRIGEQARKYKETNDLYDLEAESRKSFDETLEGLQGQDYAYMQNKVIDARDRLASLFKGKGLKDIRTPEFQTEFYNIAKDLRKEQNGITTSLEQMKQAKALAETRPSFVRAEVDRYLQKQAALPPGQRDVDILKKIQTDPLFFNAYDYSLNLMKDFERSTYSSEKQKGREVQHYEHQYIADLGEYDSNGNFQYNVSDAVLDKHLADPRFYAKMEGMIPADLALRLRKEGNDGALREAVREQASEFIKGIKSLGPDVKLKSSKFIPQESSADRKQNNQNAQINYIMERTMAGKMDALNAFKGSFWSDDFKPVFDENDKTKVIGVKGFYKEKHPILKGKMVNKEMFWPITNDSFDSIQSIVAQIQNYSQGDKDKINFIDPTPQGEAPKKPTKAGRFD